MAQPHSITEPKKKKNKMKKPNAGKKNSGKSSQSVQGSGRDRAKGVKLIDLLEQALKEGGFDYERDGWTEVVPCRDECGWIDIFLPWNGDKRQEVHLYFDKNQQRLTEVSVWERERAWVEGDAKPIAIANAVEPKG